MLNALASGRYLPGRSILHRSDPRSKIVLTLIFALVAVAARSYLTLILMLLMSFGMAQGIGRSLRHSLRGLKPVAYLAVFTAISQLFFGGGPALAESGVLSLLSREGGERSLMMILRLAVLVNGTSLLTATTPPLTLAAGLQWLMKPLQRLGLPVGEIAMMMSLALRFIPVVAEEAEKLFKEHAARSPQFAGGNLLQRARSCMPLVVPLFTSVVRRGDALAAAMDARCYGACPERTRMHPLRFASADITCVEVMLVFLVILLYMESS
jgi:energy-coupling factor transport system permease protein